MATVVFVCLHNAGRSQMSAALFEQAPAVGTVRCRPGARPIPMGMFTRRSSR